MEYKKHYTDEELNEVVGWFKSHFDELPASIYIDKATYVKDLLILDTRCRVEAMEGGR